MNETFLFMSNAAAGRYGVDGGTVFTLEAIRFCRKRGARVVLVGPRRPFERLKQDFREILDGLELRETPSYDLDKDYIPGFRAAWLLLVRGLRARSVAERVVRETLDQGDVGIVNVYLQDHLAETIPAFHLKKVFGDKVRLCYARHLMVYSLFSDFHDVRGGGRRLPGPRMLYHYLTQSWATRQARKYDVTFSVANALDREFLVGKGFKPEQVVVTPYAPDREAIAGSGAVAKTDHAVYLGRYHPQKGQEDLIEIARLFGEKTGKALTIDLMGNLDPLKAQTPAEMRERFVFHGSVYNEEKFRRLKAGRVFVFPSYHESFGLVILEAMACGVPVVAYDLPVYRGIFDRGIVKVPVGDKPAFASALVRLYADDGYYQQLCRDALEQAAKYDWNSTFTRLFGS